VLFTTFGSTRARGSPKRVFSRLPWRKKKEPLLYPYIKSLHLIFVVTWFAGLFYIPRLFIYQIEASQRPSPDREILGEQLKKMAKRLWYIITWPSAVLCTLFAVWLLILMPAWL